MRVQSIIMTILGIVGLLAAPAAVNGQENPVAESIPVLQATYQENQELLENADAVILSRDTEIEIPDARSRDTVEEVWMKILSGNGKNIFGDLKVLFDERFETVTLLAAETQTPDGRLVPLMDGADNEIIPPWLMDAAVYGAIKQRVISFSGVEPGAVIHYKVRIETRYPADERQISGHHAFQDEIPVLREDLTIRVSNSIPFKYAIAGKLETPDVKKGRFQVYSWSREDTPMIQMEWGSVPMQNIVPRLEYSCAPNWDEATAWFRNRFGKVVEMPFDSEELLKNILDGCVTDVEKASAIYHWVCSSIRTIDIPMSLAGYDPTPPVTTLERRFGDIRDKSVLLMALLQAAGFNGEWILFNRDPVVIEPTVPSIEQFDSVGCIMELPARRSYWLDTGMDNVPFGCFFASMGRKGLRIGKTRYAIETIPVLPPEMSQSRLELNLTCGDDNSVSGDILWKGEGYFAYLARESGRDLTPEERQRIYQQSIVDGIPGAIVQQVSESDWSDMRQSPWIRVTFTGGNIMPREGDVRVVEIPSVSLPFSQIDVTTASPDRDYPMRLESTARETVSVNLRLPKGTTILYAPKTVDRKSKGANWQFKAQTVDAGYRCDETFRWSATDFEPAVYREIRDMMDGSRRLEQQLILLKPNVVP